MATSRAGWLASRVGWLAGEDYELGGEWLTAVCVSLRLRPLRGALQPHVHAGAKLG